MATIGEKIRKIRKEKGLTVKQLGKLCNISEPNMGNYERGVRTPKRETLKKIANALEINVNLLYDDYEFRDVYEQSNIYDLDKSYELIEIYSKGIIHWINDSLINAAESEFLYSHYAELLLRYKMFIEHSVNKMSYWDSNKETIIEGYKKISKELSNEKIQELYFKQSLESDILDLHNWIDSFVSNYVKTDNK